MTKIKELTEKINTKLDSLGLFGGACLAVAQYHLKHYSEKNWEDYCKETGNFRPIFLKPKNAIEAMIDEVSNYKNHGDENLLKFLDWVIDGFAEGFNE